MRWKSGMLGSIPSGKTAIFTPAPVYPRLCALLGPLLIEASALVRLSTSVRCSASGSRSGALAVPHTAERPAAAFDERVVPRGAAP